MGVAGEDLREDSALNLVNVRGHFLDEPEGGLVLLREVIGGGGRGGLLGGLRHG